MNSVAQSPETSARPQHRVLQRLYLTLMFRGRRMGNQRRRILGPAASFALSTLTFVLFGFVAFLFHGLNFATFAASLHAMTFLMIGMNLATTSGNILFSTEEADVLLHRPIEPRAILAAKIRVIVMVTLVLAIALNIGGLIAGVMRADGSWLFIPAHLISLTLETIFCASFVVLAYNLCLRWFGRERLENLMTSVQVLVAVAAIVGGQVVPRLISKTDLNALSSVSPWLSILPPAWFGALDTVLSGRGFSPGVLGLAACGIVATLATAWFGVDRLAATYEQGLVMLNEAGPGAAKPGIRRGRRVNQLLRLPLVRIWIGDAVERSAFRLAIAELTRSRGVKLRVYPMLAQFLAFPMVMFLGGASRSSAAIVEAPAVAFAGAFLAMAPLLVIDRLRPSEDWRAAAIFQQAPLSRPAALFHGTRKAVILLLYLPGLLLVLALGSIWLRGNLEVLLLLLPGLIAMPAFSLFPGLGRMYLPFSQEPELEGVNSQGCLLTALFLTSSFIISGVATWAWMTGWFGWLLLAELCVAAVCFMLLQGSINRRHLQAEG